MRAITTPRLLDLIDAAAAGGYNRQLPREAVVRQADPNGYHVLSVILYNHNDTFVHRCRLLMRVTGQLEPVVVWMDVSDADYKACPTVEEVLEDADSVGSDR